MDVEAALDELYGEPLDSFTSKRNELAAKLKAAGDGAAAAEIKRLKKPSVGAWTINQLVRGQPDAVGDLLEVREALEAADSAKDLRELSKRRRELVAELTTRAKDILDPSPHGASHQALEKVSQGLLAGGSDEERELLERGRLTREPSSSGLEALGFASAPEFDDAPAVSLKKWREVEKLRREAERLQQEAARLEQEASFSEEQARRARQKANSVAAAAAEARERADAAAQSVAS